jgi:hypothetical protein
MDVRRKSALERHGLTLYSRYNETERLAERYLPFNVDELKRVAAESINKPASGVKSIRKLAEGGFNRILEICMEDGASVLARLPYPSTSPRRLAVASEVATMDFVGSRGIRSPEVLGHSIEENSVGSEYILMEKLPGRPIGDAWFDLSEQERLQVLHDMVQLEAKMFNMMLPASGSIYYARDLPSDTHRIVIPGINDHFCVGPYASRRWWFGSRESLEVDRGPRKCNCIYPCLSAHVLQTLMLFGLSKLPLRRSWLGFASSDALCQW